MLYNIGIITIINRLIQNLTRSETIQKNTFFFVIQRVMSPTSMRTQLYIVIGKTLIC